MAKPMRDVQIFWAAEFQAHFDEVKRIEAEMMEILKIAQNAHISYLTEQCFGEADAR